MKEKEFGIWFANENYDKQLVIVKAFNLDDAVILAKAERIKCDCDHTLHSIEELT
ncbi:MAG: hypothetical protein GQ474_08045 [Sulfurimonas sp.]|nr:hypothetical protein [Sulfurimonas sp.]